jgi:hypothetical protein
VSYDGRKSSIWIVISSGEEELKKVGDGEFT